MGPDVSQAWQRDSELTWQCEWPGRVSEPQPGPAAGCTAAECVSIAAPPPGTAAASGRAAPATAGAS